MRHLRFVAGLLAFSAASLVVALLMIVSLAPMFTDLTRVVLTSGSMAPSIMPGDVVLSAPVAAPVEPGTVLVFEDPHRSGGLVTHRVVEALPEGSYRTKGDANTDADSALVTQDMVVGRGTLLVPVVGMPAAWMQQGHPWLALVALVVLTGLLWLCRYALLDRYDPWRTKATAPAPARHPLPPRLRVSLRWSTTSTLVVAPALLLALAGMVGPQLGRGAYSDVEGNSGNFLAAARLYYLKTNAPGNTTSATLLPLSTTVPTLGTLPNYDTNRDSAPGLLLAKSASLNETDSTKIQRWNLQTPVPLTLSGHVTLRLWTAMKSFSPTKSGSMQVGLYDCNPPGSSCQQFATATVTSSGAWSGGSSAWVAKDFDFGTVSRTINANRHLQIRVIVRNSSADDMLVAYDTTSYPSVLRVQ